MASTATSTASLEKLLPVEDYQSLSAPVREKISQALRDQADECACLLTLHDSEKKKNGDLIATLKKDLDAYKKQVDYSTEKLDLVVSENSTLISEAEILKKKLEESEAAKRSLEKSLDELRHQRDSSQFNANALQSQLEFKDVQLAQLKADMEVMRGELDNAVQSKFQALVNQDEVEVKGKELELKEAQLEKEKIRMQKQIDMLNTELDKRNTETIELRKESNKTFMELQHKLETRASQVTTLQEKYDRLEQVYKEREKESKELRDKLTGQAQDEIDYRVHLEAQLNAQKAFVQAHKEALDATKQKCDEMQVTIVELKTKLDAVNSKQAGLEEENEELKRELKERVDHFNEQMKAADEMLFVTKAENLDKSLETLSPYAVEVSRRLREGLTYTDVIKLYAEANEDLVVKQGIIEALQGDMAKIMDELKDVAPKMRRKCDRLHEALQLIDQVTAAKEKLEHEKCLVDEAYEAERSKCEVLRRENDRNKAYVKDLCKQLCLFLKKEAEERGIPVPITEERHNRSPNSGRRASLDLNALVETRLLTFSCLEELQQRNLELLETVRILEKELEQKFASQNESQKQKMMQTESQSDAEKALEQMKEQNETQKQHLKYLMILLRQNPEGIEYNEDFKSFTARTRVSVLVQTDESSVKYTVKEFEALEAELALTKTRLEARISSLLGSETQLRADLRQVESEANELKVKTRKLVSDNEYKEEMLSTLRHNAEITAAQTEALEKTNRTYRESIVKNEGVMSALHQQLTTVTKQLSSAEITVEQYRRDIEHLKENVRDLTAARETLARDKSLHTQLMSQVEAIRTQMTLSDQVGKARLETKLEDSLKEVNGLRHKLAEEASLHTSKLELMQKNLDTIKARMDEEVAAKDTARAALEKTKVEMKNVEAEVDKLKSQLEVAKRASLGEAETNKQLETLRNDLLKTQGELKDAQKLVAVTKANEKSIQEICVTFEKHNKDLLEKVKTTQATYDVKVAELTAEVSSLTAQLKATEEKLAARSDPGSAPVFSNIEHGGDNEVVTLTLQVESLQQQLRASESEKEKLRADYVRELQRHVQDSDSVPRLTEALEATRNNLQAIQKEKLALESKIAVYERQLSVRQGDLDVEKTRVRQELEEVRAQNETLYKALDELSSQCNQSLNEMENSSISSDQELRGNENVISVIKTLRQQCSLARIDKQQVECEVRVLRSDKEMLSRKLAESNDLLNAERNKNLTNEKTLEKHAELVKKIEMMELVSDSNRILREDRDKLQAQLDTRAKEKDSFDSRVVEPLKAKISTLLQDLEVKNQQIEHLRKQSEMWKKRSDELVEKMNKSNPEDIKRLNLEKETLSKQLVSERDSYRSNLEELKILRAEANTQKDQLSALNKQVDELKTASQELSKVRSELDAARAEVSSLTAVKTELETATAQLDTVQKDVVAKAQLIDNLKKLARRYKTQFEETTKTLEEKEKTAKAIQEEEEKVRSAAVAAAVESQLKEKDELLAKYEGEKATHETEMNNFKTTLMQREERMKEVLKKCKQKMATQVLEINQLKKAAGGSAGISTPSVVTGPSAQDLEDMERTIAELREERDKLTRDNEAMLQKNNMLTRHINVQSTSSSESLGAKPTQDTPPTANIKPTMSGAVTPWRETQPVNPFVASVRPMLSSEPRTVVVAPTNLLEPPSSSSSGPRQATILPNIPSSMPSATQARASPVPTAEEAESPEMDQSQQQSSSSNTSASGSQAASIVALVLPQERSDSQQASQQVVTGSQAVQQAVTGSQSTQQVSGSQANQQVTGSQTSQIVTGSQAVQQVVTGSQTGQQVVTGSQTNNQSVVTGSQNQQVVTGSQSAALVSGSSTNTGSTSNNQQQVSGSQTSPLVTGSTSSGSQIVTGSNQGDEAVAGPSPQYRGEVPSTSTSQQVTDNSSNTVTTSRGNIKRARGSDGVADSLVTAETTEEDEEGRNKRRRVLEVEYQVPTSSQRDELLLILSSDEEEEDGCEEGGGEGEENEEEEEEEEAGDVEMEGRERHVYEHEPDGVDYDEAGVTAPHNSSEPSSSQPPSYEEGGDGIVPSTPTLYIPRPSHAVSSPHVPSGRFTFSSDVTPLSVGGGLGGTVPGDNMADPSHSVPEQVATLEYETSGDPGDVSSDGVAGEEEGREAEAVPPMGAGAQRIPPLVSVRRGRGARGQRVTPQPIVWEEDSARGRGGYTRGTPRGGRRGRGFPGPASSSSFNRFLS